MNSIFRGKKLKDIESSPESLVSNTDFLNTGTRLSGNSDMLLSVTGGHTRNDTFENSIEEKKH